VAIFTSRDKEASEGANARMEKAFPKRKGVNAQEIRAVEES